MAESMNNEVCNCDKCSRERGQEEAFRRRLTAAQRAAQTGRRRDLQEYLKERLKD